MSYRDSNGDPPLKVAWSHPKSGGIWVFISRERNDPRFDELKRRADELQDAFDIRRTERLSEIDILRSEGASFYRSIAACDLAATRVQEKGLSLPDASNNTVPDDWPSDWYEKVNYPRWSNNNWIYFPEDGGVWILRDLTKEQAHTILRELFRHERDIAHTSASLLVNDIKRQGGTFFVDINDPAIPQFCRGRYEPPRPQAHEAEYWVGKPAPWDIELPPEDE